VLTVVLTAILTAAVLSVLAALAVLVRTPPLGFGFGFAAGGTFLFSPVSAIDAGADVRMSAGVGAVSPLVASPRHGLGFHRV
jgi:hypothetical protein